MSSKALLHFEFKEGPLLRNLNSWDISLSTIEIKLIRRGSRNKLSWFSKATRSKLSRILLAKPSWTAMRIREIKLMLVLETTLLMNISVWILFRINRLCSNNFSKLWSSKISLREIRIDWRQRLTSCPFEIAFKRSIQKNWFKRVISCWLRWTLEIVKSLAFMRLLCSGLTSADHRSLSKIVADFVKSDHFRFIIIQSLSLNTVVRWSWMPKTIFTFDPLFIWIFWMKRFAGICKLVSSI